MVSNTTESFRELLSTSNSSSSGNSSTQASLFSSILTKKPGDSIQTSVGPAYLLIDTRRFSTYSIKEINYTDAWGTSLEGGDGAVPVGFVEMVLIDTTGLSFFNLLMELFRNSLQTQAASAFFLLSTIFTGHKDDGTTETISNAQQVLTLMDMAFTFTESGSEYHANFAPMVGGVSMGQANENHDYLNDVQSISTKGRGDSVGALLSALEDQLNIQSLSFYQKYINSASATKNSDGSPLKLGKLVQYMITVPQAPLDWRSFKITNATVSKNKEQVFIAKLNAANAKIQAAHPPVGQTAADQAANQAAYTADATMASYKAAQAAKAQNPAPPTNQPTLQPEPGYNQMSFSQTTTITGAIKAILEASNQVLEQGSQDKLKAGTTTLFKIVPTVTSDDFTYVIHFDVLPFIAPTPPATATTSQQNTATTSTITGGSTTNIGAKYPNLITYDYLFTGKNSHIIDLKVEFSPMSVQALNTDVQVSKARYAKVAEQGQTAKAVDKASDGSKVTSDFAPELRSNDPIFFPIRTIDQQNGMSTQKTEAQGSVGAIASSSAKQEFTKSWALIHFQSTMNLNVTVRGNPNILKKYNDRSERGGIPPHPRILVAKDINKLASSGQNTAETNYNTILANSLASAKQNYYSTFIAPLIKSSLNPPTSGDQLLNGVDVAIQAPYIKLNILAPNVDYTGQYKPGEPMFTDEFFFNGVYRILTVDTIFSSGEFHHILGVFPEYNSMFENDTASTKTTRTLK
jgi:hypothetical protein